MVLKVAESKINNDSSRTSVDYIKVSNFINCVFEPKKSDMTSVGNDNKQALTYTADTTTNSIDTINSFLEDLTPEFFERMIPAEYMKFADSAHNLDRDNDLAYKNLPRTADGKVDVLKVKDSLQKAKILIQEQNKKALEEMNYGVYKEAINSVSMLEVFLGPEAADFIKKTAKKDGIDLPEFLTSGVCMFDNKVLDWLSNDKPEVIKEVLEVKSAESIRSDIYNQNESLENLCEFEINTEEDAKIFLNRYLEITGTTFSCEKIENYYEIHNDENAKPEDKLEQFASSCGVSSNYLNATKNKILTNVFYEVGLRTIVPTLINKFSSHPVGKGVSTALPTIIEFVETATLNRAEGEYINLNNFTYDSTMEMLADGAVRGFLINLPNTSWGKCLLERVPVLKCLLSPEKGAVANNIFLKAFVTKPYALANRVTIQNYLAKMNKLLLPNIFAEDGIYRVLSPEYNAYKISENEWRL